MNLMQLKKIVFFTPVLLTLICLIHWAFTLHKQSTAIARTESAVDLIILLDNLSRNLAIERGLTAGVIGALGVGVQAEALINQRQLTDTAEQNLNDFLLQTATDSTLSPVFFNKLTILMREQLKQRRDIHKQVDELNTDVSAFAYYSLVNTSILDAIEVTIAQIADSSIQRDLLGFLTLSASKEEAGKARGALNGFFSSYQFSDTLYEKIRRYLFKEQSAMHQTEILLGESMKADLEQLQNTTIAIQVAEIKDEFIKNKGAIKNFEGINSPKWFELATDHINLLDQLQKKVTQNVLQRLQQVEIMFFIEKLLLFFCAVLLLVFLIFIKKGMICYRRAITPT